MLNSPPDAGGGPAGVVDGFAKPNAGFAGVEAGGWDEVILKDGCPLVLGAAPKRLLVPAALEVGWLLAVPKLNPVDAGLLVPPKTFPLAAPEAALPPKRLDVPVEPPMPPNGLADALALLPPNGDGAFEAGWLLTDPKRLPPPWLPVLACPNGLDAPLVPDDGKLKVDCVFPGPDIVKRRKGGLMLLQYVQFVV